MSDSINIKKGDITKFEGDCIVNAANGTLLGGGGVDFAVHRAAGIRLFFKGLTMGGCKTGNAKITKGYNLKAKYIIHAVGPKYSGKPRDGELLASCYIKSLDLAYEHSIHSIAFPSISTGIYKYPLSKAVPIAIQSVLSWLNKYKDYDLTVNFVCYDEKTYKAYMEYRALFQK